MGPQSKDRGKTAPAIICIKILLHTFNLIYLIIGASVLAIGIWTKVQLSQYLELTELYYEQAPYIMIGVGALILLVAIGGFFCTAKDKIALLYMYAVFIVILAILQIGAGIAGGVLKGMITDKLREGLNESLTNYKTKGNIETWNSVQQSLKCCGVDKPEDWLAVYGNKLPASCYQDNKEHTYSPSTVPGNVTTATTTTTQPPSTNATTTTTTPTTTTTTTAPITSTTTTTVTAPTSTNATITTTVPKSAARRKRQAEDDATQFKDGCVTLIKNNMIDYLGVIVGVCVGFVFLQVMGAVLACCLAKKTSKNNYEQIY